MAPAMPVAAPAPAAAVPAPAAPAPVPDAPAPALEPDPDAVPEDEELEELLSLAGASAANTGLTDRPNTNAIIDIIDVAFPAQPILAAAILYLLFRLRRGLPRVTLRIATKSCNF